MARLSRDQLPDMGDEWKTIKERRDRHELSQEELGRLANPEHPIHRNTIGAMEKGASGHRAKMARVLKVLDDLDAEAGFDAPPLPAPDAKGAEVVEIEARIEGDVVTYIAKGGDPAAIRAALTPLVEEELRRRRRPHEDD